MKIKNYFTRIIIGIITALLCGAIAFTWKVKPSVCILILLYVSLYYLYIVIPWRYKKWGEPKHPNAEDKKLGLHFKTILIRLHSIYHFIIVAVPIICALFLLSLVYFPDYADSLIAQSFTKQEYKKVLTSKALTLQTASASSTSSNLSFIASIQSSKGLAYPTSPFLELLLNTFFDPIWGYAWNALLGAVAFLIIVRFMELLGGTTYHFR